MENRSHVPVPLSEAATRDVTADCLLFWEKHVPALLAAGRDTTLRELSVVAHFVLSGTGCPGGDGSRAWFIRVEGGHVTEVAEGNPAGAEVRVHIPAAEFLSIALGERDYRESFFAGRIEVEGDVELLLSVAVFIPVLQERFPFLPENYKA